jgi:hypothetical protein
VSEDNPIVKFTNIHGETNYGIIVDTHPEGMKEVLWDEFTALLKRLTNANDFVKAGLSLRRSWVRVEGDQMERLPITAKVPWVERELAELQKQMQRGGKVTVTTDTAAVQHAQEGDGGAANVFRGQEVD